MMIFEHEMDFFLHISGSLTLNLQSVINFYGVPKAL